ncbi:MAG: translation initiation factor IF-3 [Limnochordales bacterium]|nr:translation initiation factor IF-3 [Limnochordales bacterium]
MNGEIRAREVRVIDSDGNQLGIMSVREALRLAQERDLDLVEVAPNAYPPVCRIMNYGKFRYEQGKREREARKRQKIVDVKELSLTLKTGEHDLGIKTRNAQRILQQGDKVKMTVRFRGREIVHADLARTMLENIARQLADVSVVERPPVVEGRQLVMVLTPRPDKVERAGRADRAGEGDSQPAEAKTAMIAETTPPADVPEKMVEK